MYVNEHITTSINAVTHTKNAFAIGGPGGATGAIWGPGNSWKGVAPFHSFLGSNQEANKKQIRSNKAIKEQ